eukprot:1157526-Pelagomonas_calceolata.AAC.7
MPNIAVEDVSLHKVCEQASKSLNPLLPAYGIYDARASWKGPRPYQTLFFPNANIVVPAFHVQLNAIQNQPRPTIWFGGLAAVGSCCSQLQASLSSHSTCNSKSALIYSLEATRLWAGVVPNRVTYTSRTYLDPVWCWAAHGQYGCEDVACTVRKSTIFRDLCADGAQSV